MGLRIGIGLVIIVITITIHAFGSALWIRYLTRHFELSMHKWKLLRVLRVLISSIVVMVFLHLTEIIVWSVLYLNLPDLNVLKTFEQATYFSLVTYTTLGYGDITLGPTWRILSGLEAINGIILIGWTTAMFYSLVQNVTQKHRQFKNQDFKGKGNKK